MTDLLVGALAGALLSTLGFQLFLRWRGKPTATRRQVVALVVVVTAVTFVAGAGMIAGMKLLGLLS